MKVTAPRVNLPLRKIIWSSDGIQSYQDNVNSKLRLLRHRWLRTDSFYSISVLLKMTNLVLDEGAAKTNTFHNLRDPGNLKSKKIPANILSAKRKIRRLQSRPTNLTQQMKLRQAKHVYRSEIRKVRIQECYQRDKRLCEILQTNPSSAFQYINSFKRTHTSKIETLTVNEKTYENDTVADGFFDAMSSLKSTNIKELHDDPQLTQHLSNYEIIRILCSNANRVPPANIDTTTDLLKRLKKMSVTSTI